MTDKLDSLIRHKKWELDNQRKLVSAKEDERGEIVDALQKLADDFQIEHIQMLLRQYLEDLK